VYRWQRGGAVNSAAVTFADREATAVGKVRLAKGTTALPTAWFANSIGPCCWQIRWTRLLAKNPALPTAWAEVVGKAGARFGGKAQLCQQPELKMLAKLGFPHQSRQLCQQLWPIRPLSCAMLKNAQQR
jgi:hypothetical protein